AVAPDQTLAKCGHEFSMVADQRAAVVEEKQRVVERPAGALVRANDDVDLRGFDGRLQSLERLRPDFDRVVREAGVQLLALRVAPLAEPAHVAPERVRRQPRLRKGEQLDAALSRSANDGDR